MAADEVNNVGEEKKKEEKKLRKWRMPQEQIDLILSWSPKPARPPRYDVDIGRLQISEALKERLRRVEAEDAVAKREMDRYQEEQQEWVKAELAAHGYVECEIDDDDNPCVCGCAYAADHDEEEEEGLVSKKEEGDDDCYEDETEEKKKISSGN
uniref:Uncharacterized protein n=1 Tax=Oryza meridionalis TaxID=40149 RepID=A0A0E0EF52_9ORYZ